MRREMCRCARGRCYAEERDEARSAKSPGDRAAISVGISSTSDLGYAMRLIAGVARETIGPSMKGPVETYRALLDQEGLAYDVSDEPQVYIAPTDSWTNVIVRYLVAARERRKWASALHLRIGEELAKPDHQGRVVSAYPVQRVELGSQTTTGTQTT
jgi:hypothetical protein